MKSIVIAVSGGGLGNRLNAMFTAVALHIHTGLPMLVQWNPTSDFECSIHDLFDVSSCVQHIERYPFYPFVQKEESYGEYVLIAAYYSSHPPPFVDVITSEPLENQLNKIQKYKDNYYFAVHGPQMYSFGLSNKEIGTKFFELFRPKENILREVCSFIQSNNPRNGIHMRLTDKVKINGYSYDNVSRDVESMPINHSEKTFICSDENTYEDIITNKLPNSCHIPKGVSVVYSDSTSNGAILREKNTCVPAFIDFLVFSYCENKYGVNSDSCTSTFFACAKFLQESFQDLVR